MRKRTGDGTKGGVEAATDGGDKETETAEEKLRNGGDREMETGEEKPGQRGTWQG